MDIKVTINHQDDEYDTKDSVCITDFFEWISLILFCICYLIGLVVIFQFIFLFNVIGFINSFYASLISMVIILIVSLFAFTDWYKNQSDRCIYNIIKIVYLTVLSLIIIISAINILYIGFGCDECLKNISLNTILVFLYSLW